MIRLTVRRFGHSLGVTLPAQLARKLELRPGQQLNARMQGSGLVIALPQRKRYTLPELLAQCDPKAPYPEDMAAWQALKPIGNEVW